MKEKTISFGDDVRVRATPATQAAGVAGLIGSVAGETTPSATKAVVIGDLSEDYALNVYFEDREEGVWFAPDQLEFVDHAVGTEIVLTGVEKKWVRNEAGGWDEVSIRKKRKSFWELIVGLLIKRTT
jgi:hypothetical protein